MDQAQQLRQLAQDRFMYTNATRNGPAPARPLRVFAVTSGKGGVGKTNVTANLAVALGRRGKRVLVLDGDLGLANLDILLGIKPMWHIGHVLSGEKRLSDIIVEGPPNVRVLPGSSGVSALANLSEGDRYALLTELDTFDDPIDVLIIDTSAGIGSNVLYFAAAAQQTIVVTTPEPTAITDAYAMMKVLATEHGERRFLLLPNNVQNERAAQKIYADLAGVATRFLDISISLVGYVPADANLPRAVRRRRLVVDAYPDSPASQAFDRLAGRLLATRIPEGPKGGLQFMWRQFLQIA
ncbi:MinD/ParA family protein [bacterium]|nr:MinD/ParA family protein [bacterium]